MCIRNENPFSRMGKAIWGSLAFSQSQNNVRKDNLADGFSFFFLDAALHICPMYLFTGCDGLTSH